MSNGFVTALLVAAGSLASAVCDAQSATASPSAPESEPPAERSIEGLNLVGGAVTMPPFSDSLLGIDSGFRRLEVQQLAARRAEHARHDEPLPLQGLGRPAGRAEGGIPRQLRPGVRGTAGGRVDLDGRQGVYAVLPNEVGLSYFPLTAPSLNVRLRGTRHTYLKTAAQRSLDAAGSQSTVDRNPSGFRFLPAGNGVLLVSEVGYHRASSAAAPRAWLRAGYMRNSTRYTNRLTGQQESGNYCAYVLMDYQLRMPDPATPGRGLYLGGMAMTVPSEFNAYDTYYEARVYQRGTFASRPTDVLALVASYRGHSKYLTDGQLAQGRTVWTSSSLLTGTYTLHVARKTT